MAHRDEVFSFPKYETAPVVMPEWGGKTFCVRSLSHAERRKLFATQEREPDLYLPRLIVAVLCDDAGNRVFSDDDVVRISEMNGKPLDRIATAFMKLSALDSAEVKAIEKNS